MNIVALRRTLGLSQSDLAERLQTTQSTVSRWERGQAAPSPAMQAKIARLMAGTPAVRDWHVLRMVQTHPGLAKLFDPSLEILEVSDRLVAVSGIGRENLMGLRLSGIFERALRAADDAGMFVGVPVALDLIGPVLPIKGCDAPAAWSWTVLSLGYGAPCVLAQGRLLNPETDAITPKFSVIPMEL